MHIPAIHGLSIIIVFAGGLSILMLSLVFPYSAFSYNKSENYIDYSLPHFQSAPLISDEARISPSNNSSSSIGKRIKNNPPFTYKVGGSAIGENKDNKNTSGENFLTTSSPAIPILHTGNTGDISKKPANNNIISHDTPKTPKTSDTSTPTTKREEKKSPLISTPPLIVLPEKYRELLSEYRLRVNKDTNYVLENNVWYGYKYNKYKNFGKDAALSISMLKEYGLNPESTLLAISGDIIYFVSDYTKIRLVSESVIGSVSNKNRFLEQVLRDQKYIELDSDTILSKLKSETLRITAGKSKSQKISAIYDYVLTNIEYPAVFSTSNGRILSGISSIDSKIGSCGGYVNTFLYMLSFAGIDGAQRIDGNVIDAADFPNIGHAWLKLDSRYYDPTFDDSSGSVSKSRTYYALPYDIFYGNRYDYGTLPGNIKTLSMSERKDIIRNNLRKISSSYELKNYPIFAYYNVNNTVLPKKVESMPEVPEEEMEFNSAPEEKSVITPEQSQVTHSNTKTVTDTQVQEIQLEKPQNIQDLKFHMPYYEVKKFTYNKQGIEYIITKMDFYTITPDNFTDLMNQVEYKFQGMILYKWDNGTYRLAYRVEEQ